MAQETTYDRAPEVVLEAGLAAVRETVQRITGALPQLDTDTLMLTVHVQTHGGTGRTGRTGATAEVTHQWELWRSDDERARVLGEDDEVTP